MRLAAITIAIRRQGPVANGSSSNAVQPLPPTEPREEDLLDIAVPAAYWELSENTMTAFSTLSHSMQAVCSLYQTEFWQVTESLQMETGDRLFRNVDLIFTDPPYNVRSKVGKLD